MLGGRQQRRGDKGSTMRVARGRIWRWSCVSTCAALLLAPAAADARSRRSARSGNVAVASAGFGAFTPAAADPRVAAAFARNGLGTDNFAGGAFRFTPSGSPGSSHRAVTVAMRAKVAGRQETAKALQLATDQVAPSAYSLGASIGWKHFALSGDVARVDGGLLPLGRESADVGLSFSGKRWATKVDLAADRLIADQPAFGIDQSWSVGLGGSYALTRNLDVNGGVRYKTQHEELYSLTDNRRDSQAVYLGTTFKF